MTIAACSQPGIAIAGAAVMDWHALFVFHMSPLELFVRGSLLYWFLFLVFRFVIRRDIGALGIGDVLLLVLVADAAQNGMAGNYQTVAEGFVLVGTLIGWNVLIDAASYHFSWIRRLASPPPLLIIDHGRLLPRNMRREFITRSEVDTQLRLRGIDDPSQVRTAYLESDGTFSVIAYANKTQGGGVRGARRRGAQ